MPTAGNFIVANASGFRTSDCVEALVPFLYHNELCRGSLCCEELYPGWYDARKPIHSNFAFVKKYFNGELTVQSIFSHARKLGFCSFLVEKCKNGNGTYLEESDILFKDGYTKAGFIGSEAWRVSFFTSEINTFPKPNDFLGYVVIKKEKFDLKGDVFQSISEKLNEDGLKFYQQQKIFESWYVYESVLKPPKRPDSQNTFLCCKRSYQIDYNFGQYNITGALFAQQNSFTFVCVHVALRTVLSLLLRNGDITYKEINRRAGISNYPCIGLTPKQIDQVLASFNKENIFSRNDFITLEDAEDYRERLYGHIESGCPCLLAFYPPTGDGHIVPILGHTFDENSWVPYASKGYFNGEKKYYLSSNWSNAFLMHDGNFGVYSCVPKDFFEEHTKVQSLLSESAVTEKTETETTKSPSVILWGLHNLPDYLCFDAIKQRGEAWYGAFSNDLLKDYNKNPKLFSHNEWLVNFLSFADIKELTYRFLCISRDEYLAYVKSIRIEPDTVETMKNSLPSNNTDALWMVEVSCPQLFSSTRAKFGEMILSLTDKNPFLHKVSTGDELPEDEKDDGIRQHLIRLPGCVVIYGDKQGPHEPVRKKTSVIVHTPLYTD